MTALALLLLATLPITGTAPATVHVDGLRGDDGHIVVALFADPEGFPHDFGLAARTGRAGIHMGQATVRFDDVPAGRYAVVAFHDADDDGRVRRNLLGIPKEGIALSRGLPGRPLFDRTTVALGAEAVTVELTVRYL